MNQQYINALGLATAFLLLFALGELLYHKMKVRVELTRKLVHLGTGLLTLLFPILLENHWLVLALCASFAVILFVSLKYNLLPSINAIDRESVGSLAYPVSVFTCYLVYEYYGHYHFFYIPILILAICDPVAALFGKRWPIGKYKIGKDNKTLMGSSMFFISAVLVCAALTSLAGTNMHSGVIACLAIAGITTLAEALSSKGSDNLTIPFSAIVTLITIDYLTR